MCGIVGYIGNKQAYPILIKVLQRLEYRGYDSAGIALINDNDNLNLYKSKGKVADLIHFAEKNDVSGTIGIAHTRWATHGEPNQINAHPHYSQSEELVIIHNGIIENYAVLKKGLQKHGYTFQSETTQRSLFNLLSLKKSNICLPKQSTALNEVVHMQLQLLRKPKFIVAARKGSLWLLNWRE